ncbi:MAG: MATE family efflux transporter, partial [Lachnospiraceae bacterium]|nr:MATE family efflux transporter [Lachnospiraceae bacterium]
GISCMAAVFVVFQRLAGIETDKVPFFSIDILKRIMTVAVPSILQQSFISVGNIIIQGTINGFGSGVMAGYSAAVKLNNLVITSFTTLGNGISNYTAQNIGAGKLPRIRGGFRAGIKMVWMLSAPLFVLYFFAGKWILYAFIDDPTALALQTGISFLRILSPFYFIISMKFVADGILRGAGMMGKFMVATFLDLILRVGLAILLSHTILRETGIWCAWPIGWTIAALLSLMFYKTGKWNKQKKNG